MEQIAFYTLAAITLLSALGVVLMRNVLHSALLLGLCLAGVAGLFGTLSADFLFAAQIMVYVGGIALLVLFVVLLSGRHSQLSNRQGNELWPGVAVICALTLWAMWGYVQSFASARALAKPEPTAARLGAILMDEYALPFELISLILIVALIGAVLFSHHGSEA
jgi:NADH:ubiquinone oxidoreductase subunit 6 (subunit J)